MRSSFTVKALLFSFLLHAYVAWRLLPPLGLGPVAFAVAVLVLAVSAALVPSPFLLRGRQLAPRTADALAWAGYFAMGASATLLVVTLLRDAALLLLALVQAWRPGAVDGPRVERLTALFALGAAAFMVGFGLWNARRTAAVKHVDLPLPGLPKALQGFTLVQLSDVHVGPTIRRRYLQAIVDRVNALEADAVVLTGDLIDGSVAALREHVAPFGDLRSRHGSYVVLGNHEYYHGAGGWLRHWRELGMQPLVNEHATLDHYGARLLLAGVTDYSGGHFHPEHHSDPAAALATPLASGVAPPRDAGVAAVKILLAHQPRSAPAAAAAGFDVQLSGHTHGGQFWPWNHFVPLQQPFVAGLKRLGRLLVYVSRGTGYWGPPLRFLAPSEITRLRLVAA